MKKVFGLVALTIMFAACKDSYIKSKEGIEYKIISEGSGAKATHGDILELNFERVYKDAKMDTILMSTKDMGTQPLMLDSTRVPALYIEIFSKVKKGDSVVIRIPTDSILKNGGENVPPFIKKGQFIYANYKVVNIFKTTAEADSAFTAQRNMMMKREEEKAAAQLIIDDKLIADYLVKNKIAAIKAPKGTYVEIINQGTGDLLDTSKVAKVLYTGKGLLDGKTFDSNVDPAFNHMVPISVNMWAQPGEEGSVIAGWTDGLSLLKKGAKAKLYIPSSLAYGSQSRGEDIQANEILMFEVDVVDVLSAATARAEAAAEMKMQQEAQKKYMDSVKKANPQPENK